MSKHLNAFVLKEHYKSRFTCVSMCFTNSTVVIVLHLHWRHYNSSNRWLAGLSFWGNTRNARLAVLVAVSNVVTICKGTVAVGGAVRCRRAVHCVTTALLFIIRHASERYKGTNIRRSVMTSLTLFD